MWFRTVSLLRWSSCAICSVERPRSSRRSTSACLGVRCGWGGPRRLVVFDVLDLAEDTDHTVTVAERNRADLDGDALAISVDEHPLVIRAG